MRKSTGGISPSDSDIILLYARSLKKAGDTRKAAAWYLVAARHLQGSFGHGYDETRELYNQIIGRLEECGLADLAEKYYRKLVGLEAHYKSTRSPEYGRAMVVLAEFLLQRKKDRESSQYYVRAVHVFVRNFFGG